MTTYEIHAGSIRRQPLRRSLYALLALVLAILRPDVMWAAPASPPAVLDWSVPGGHHYTQTNGFPFGSSPMGYSIVDDNTAHLWTAFQAHGGVTALGYPASRRFVWGGFVTQVTQKAVLQWRPESSSIDFVNVFDDLSRVGKDDWLSSVRAVPRPLTSTLDVGLTWNNVVARHVDLLRARPALLRRYLASADALDRYGLPASPVVDAGPMYVIRLQRAVFQEWKVAEPWAAVGDVTVANGGDVAKEAGAFPYDATRPFAAPAATWPTAASYSVTGTSTWYGPGFVGKAMANGNVYQPTDPTTTASNAYPLGSLLRVTSLTTKKSIQVYVRDTGKFTYPDVVDLSPAAFTSLGVPLSTGVISVTVDLLSAPGLAATANTQAPSRP